MLRRTSGRHIGGGLGESLSLRGRDRCRRGGLRSLCARRSVDRCWSDRGSLRGNGLHVRGGAVLERARHRSLERGAWHPRARHRLPGHRLGRALGEDRRPVILARAASLGGVRCCSGASRGGIRARLVLPPETGIARCRRRRIRCSRRALRRSWRGRSGRSRSGCWGRRIRPRGHVGSHALVSARRRGAAIVRRRGGAACPG